MLKKMLTPMLATLCTVGLMACGQTGPTTDNTQTVKLNRLASGDLQYCDASGECQTLPYGGECVALEIDIDLTTGETCQRCILEDGTSVDQGCGQSAIACVLVTLPEPDCVVCAYVNGAIIFSSCVTEEPGCTSDADCVSTDGRAVCINGQCTAQPGCSADTECPTGFICQLDVCPMYDCGPNSDCLPPPCNGYCVPAPTECSDSSECPAGMACQVYCMGACDSAGGCEQDVCKGVCEPVQQECYADADCPEGFVCEFYYGTDGGSSDPSSGAAAPRMEGGYCVPQQNGCLSDTDCPRGMACQMNCMPCAPDSPACDTACQGVCVQVETYCWSDADCAAGQICEFVYGQPTDPSSGSPDLVAPQGVCVPAPQVCTANFDCSWDGFGLGVCWNGECIYQVSCDTNQALCDMTPPVCEDGKVPSIIGACYGPCVDPAMCIVPTPCVVSGCSGEICAAEPMFSTCEYREAYACFQTATCELQADGVCGWTQTEALTACLTAGQP